MQAVNEMKKSLFTFPNYIILYYLYMYKISVRARPLISNCIRELKGHTLFFDKDVLKFGKFLRLFSQKYRILCRSGVLKKNSGAMRSRKSCILPLKTVLFAQSILLIIDIFCANHITQCVSNKGAKN